MIAGIRIVSLSQFRLHIVRIVFILVISLFLSHFIAYQRFPFQAGYQFPLATFAFFAFFGFLVCTANWMIYPWTFGKMKMMQASIGLWRLLRPLSKHWVFTLVVYTCLYLTINQGVFGRPVNFIGFIQFLTLMLLIITLEFFIVFLYKSATDKKAIQADSSILVKSGSKMTKVKYDDISHFSSHSGVVSLYLENGRRLITQFSSLEELESILPGEVFFRVNRQNLVHFQSVSIVSKDRNRKLKIDLATPGLNGGSSLTVSRYRSKNFRSWFENHC